MAYVAGEILGLTVENVNLHKDYVSIKNTLVKTSNGVVLQETPKTSASRRIVPLAKDTIRLLKESISDKTSDSIYTKEDNYIYPRSFQHNFDMLLNKAGLPKIRLHDMRHSACSLLITSGCDVKTVSLLSSCKSTRNYRYLSSLPI